APGDANRGSESFEGGRGMWSREKGERMKRLGLAAVVVTAAALWAASASAGGWQASVPFTNQVASSPTTGGGYPVPPGCRVPWAGTCRLGPFDATHSESSIAGDHRTAHLA